LLFHQFTSVIVTGDVTSLFNYMDRMADAIGAPVEGFQEMTVQMLGS
jgi:hypothetical protein